MSSRALTLAAFGVLAAAGLVAEWCGRRGLGGVQPLGRILEAARSRPVGRAALTLIWAFLTWHFLAR